jgi:hypothetical protein
MSIAAYQGVVVPRNARKIDSVVNQRANLKFQVEIFEKAEEEWKSIHIETKINGRATT